MNDHEMPSDEQHAAMDAWDREQRSKKRRAALGVAAVLVAGFVGAAIAGRIVGVQTTGQHAANVAEH
jgi:hypothetical protein